MASSFQISSKEETNGHQWLVLDVVDITKFLEKLSVTYKTLRTSTPFPISDIDYNGLTITAENIKKKLTETQIPNRGEGNFSVARSDFGETIAFSILDEFFKTRFGYKSVRDRELVQLPGRGIDAIGVEQDGDKIILVLGEVKVSTDKKSPPSVVDDSDDCLKNQHSHHVQNLKETASKIMHAARQAKDSDTQALLLTGAMLIDQEGGLEKISLIIYSCLIRQHDRYSDKDFGSFKSSPEDFQPSAIRFTIIRIPGDLEEAVDNWLKLAKSKEEL